MNWTKKLIWTLPAVAIGLVTLGGCEHSSHVHHQQDIVDTAVAADDFNTLVTAVKEAGLVETLKGEGPYTVFAPTDAAFAALPPGTVEGLLADKAKLQKVLLYHVVAGNVTSDQVVKLDSAKTAEGSAVNIKVKHGKVYVNDATVTQADVKASNGVIHVIDKVLLPPTM
jgi:uncharacterized surface protein with fasciclin (FAS1) repeats